MANPFVTQLRFARSEFVRGLEGVTSAEGLVRFGEMNSLGWTIGHLANQENFYWNYLAQDLRIAPELRKLVGTGAPASTPPLDEMWAAWREITASADAYLDRVTGDDLTHFFPFGSRTWGENAGTLLQRNTFHYWYHLGEGMAVRQMLGHTDLPQFVGNMGALTPAPDED
jgi:hypothetical protein